MMGRQGYTLAPVPLPEEILGLGATLFLSYPVFEFESPIFIFWVYISTRLIFHFTRACTLTLDLILERATVQNKGGHVEGW